MCDVSNIPSLKERIQCYISKRNEIVEEYNNRIKALDEAANADILTHCPIKVGDVYVTENNNAWGVKRQYYKVAKLEANVDGRISVYGYKSKLDGTWGKRDNIYMFVVSVYDNYTPTNFTKVENYVERKKD